MIRAVAIVCALCAAASASPWKTSRGTLATGRLPGSWILSSDAAPGRYSEAGMFTTEPVALPFKLEATWRRLGPEAGRSMHVLVAGGIVLIKSGAIAFYAYDDAAFAQGDWKPIPGHAAQAPHDLVIEQDKLRVIVKLDGAEVGRYDLAIPRDTGNIGFGMKSAPGLRSSIYVHSVKINGQSQ
ncbi:MAG: hypothetical protein H0T46_32215 [Deltaproteobacteria bacterium]|nr:hypothetical protein [Deltaproteobacteria bacterium]